MLRRIYAIFRARNLEFVRDRSSLSWNIILPVALMFGLSFIFGGGTPPQYTVGVVQSGETVDPGSHPFLKTRHVQFVPMADLDEGMTKVARHQLDLLVRLEEPGRYWVNPESPRGYFIELALLQSGGGRQIEKAQITGDPVRYIDWVLPGILGMNMMFSCLFGVGYVVVRYRKNGFLKRLRATPLRSFEFVAAQVASRLMLIIVITTFVYTGTSWFLNTRMDGSYVTLLVITILGAVSLISMGLVVAARVTSEELAGGLLNLVTWPMMMLSGVWFSLEGTGAWVQRTAEIFPLTHVLDAARAVMIDGAVFRDVLPQIGVLCVMSALFLTIAALIFRWRPR
jgi:ABC-type multidrug transport system permease subunit